MTGSACEFRAGRLRATDPPQFHPDENEPVHVLVVDDVEDNRVVLARRLSRRGYQVTEAQSGRRALDLIAGVSFDLVLLDVVMPEMDGLEVLEDHP